MACAMAMASCMLFVGIQVKKQTEEPKNGFIEEHSNWDIIEHRL